MLKNLVKRSQFQIISITTPNRVDLVIEGDEAYITSLDVTYPATVRRAREQELIKLTAQHTYISGNTNACIELTVPQAAGRVSLMGDATGTALAGGPLTFPITTGIKESVSLGVGSGTAGITQKVLIETVHYIPAEAISA